MTMTYSNPTEHQTNMGYLATGEVIEILNRMDNPIIILSTLATAFDQWCADHDLTVDEANELINTLAEGCVYAHNQEGLPEKSNLRKEV